MKTAIRQAIALLAAFWVFAACAGADPVPLTILFTGDTHSSLTPGRDGGGGMARIAGYYERERDRGGHLLILDAGDMVTGSPASEISGGEAVFRVMNHWGLDAAAIGNHEFDFGWQKIERFRGIAEFPLLCANAFAPAPDGSDRILGDAKFKRFRYGELSVLVVAVVAEWTPAMTKREDTLGVTFVPSAEGLRQTAAAEARPDDLVVALTHVGIEHDLEIAAGAEGIDLIVGGHSHTLLDAPRIVNGVPIVHAGSNGGHIGRIELKADPAEGRILDFEYRAIEVNERLGPALEAAEREAAFWEAKVSGVVDRPLGFAKTRLHPIDMLMIANAAFLEATGADYSFHNEGGTRGSLPPGGFLHRDIWTIFPFENSLVTTRILGADIPERFYGLGPIDPDGTYTLVTNSYVRDQCERFFPSLADADWTDTGIMLRDAVIRYIERRGEIGKVPLSR